jgi:hypothetical protein
MEYFNYKDVTPELDSCVLPYIRDIQREIAAVTTEHWASWPEHDDLIYRGPGAQAWTVLPLLHTFPGYDDSKSVWVPTFTALCPVTTACMRRVPGIRSALLSKMAPLTMLTPHCGWAELSNYVLRIHVPIVLPPPREDGLPSTGVVVDGVVRHHVADEPLVFDDSKSHFAFNRHETADRIVLIIDVLRPFHVPCGTSTVPYTHELVQFANWFK